MKILVYRPEGNLGPYSPYDLQSLLKQGMIRANDLGWHDGLTEWQPVITLIPTTVAIPDKAAPVTFNAPRLDSTQVRDEDSRREYIAHEANVKSVGLLYFFISAVWFVLILGLGVGLLHSYKLPSPAFIALGIVMCVLLFYLGLGMVRLDPNIVIPVSVVAGLSLAGILIGTWINGAINNSLIGAVINAYILYLLHCDKGKVVFSPEYKAIIKATPKVRYRTSIVFKIVVGIFLLLVLDVVLSSIFMPR